MISQSNKLYNTKVGIRFNGAYRLLSAVLIAEFVNIELQ